MPIFISYSHADKEFVNKLAAHIVKNKVSVWVDTWELNVGDSIIQRVQSAIADATALLVVLSKASVESEWFKKEVSAGLMRELDEKRVLVLPVLLEDCIAPVFLREKLYADFRENFDVGLKAVLDAVGAVSNIDQARLESAEHVLDWAEDWRFENGLFLLRFTILESPRDLPMSFLTEILVSCNDVASRRYQKFVDAGLDWIGRAVIAEVLFELAEKTGTDMRLLLEDQFPKKLEAVIADPGKALAYEVTVTARKLGRDNGKDQLLHISGYLASIRDYVKSVSRKLTDAESRSLLKIIGTGL